MLRDHENRDPLGRKPAISPGGGAERLAIFINGPEGKDHPHRQGIFSAMKNGLDPLNIFGGVPTINLDYSPLWNAELIQWSAKAFPKLVDRKGKDIRDSEGNQVYGDLRSRVDSFLPGVFGLEAKGLLEGFGGGPIKRTGIIINCPALARLI